MTEMIKLAYSEHMNKNEIIDIAPLEIALHQLEKAYGFSKSELAINSEDLFEQFRNSTIQCFEFTFELAVGFTKRKLELILPKSQNLDFMDFKEIIREAAVAGLIQNPERWFDFRKFRNLSSHAYNKSKAELIYGAAKDLIEEVSFLKKNLGKK